MISASRIAGRIASTQLICSKWALENYWRVSRRQHLEVPAELSQRLQDGAFNVRQCAELDDVQLTPIEQHWMNTELGEWSDDTHAVVEPYWESLGTLLWSLHVFAEMPASIVNGFERKDTFTFTGIEPTRPSSVVNWIRSFDEAEMLAKKSHRGVRGRDEVHKQFRTASAWYWRSLMHNLQSMTEEQRKVAIKDNHSLRRVLKNVDTGISSGALRCLSDGLLTCTLDDDFPVTLKDNDLASAVAFKDIKDSVIVDSIRKHGQGRMLALRWLESGKNDLSSWDIEHVSGTNGMALGVQSIWEAGE